MSIWCHLNKPRNRKTDLVYKCRHSGRHGEDEQVLREEHEVPVPPLRGGGDDDGDGPQMEDVAQRRYVLPFPISDRRGQHLQLKLLLSPNLGTLGLKTKMDL